MVDMQEGTNDDITSTPEIYMVIYDATQSNHDPHINPNHVRYHHQAIVKICHITIAFWFVIFTTDLPVCTTFWKKYRLISRERNGG